MFCAFLVCSRSILKNHSVLLSHAAVYWGLDLHYVIPIRRFSLRVSKALAGCSQEAWHGWYGQKLIILPFLQQTMHRREQPLFCYAYQTVLGIFLQQFWMLPYCYALFWRMFHAYFSVHVISLIEPFFSGSILRTHEGPIGRPPVLMLLSFMFPIRHKSGPTFD